MPSNRVAELAAVIGTICSFSFIAGFIFPVIALALEQQGYDETAIGLNATASGLGVAAGGLLLPRLARAWGAFGVLAGGTVLCIILMLLFPSFPDYWAWLLFRFLLGASITGLFATGEAWIVSSADDETRGRTVSIYVMAMSVSFAIGALLVKWTGFEGYVPFLIAAVIVTVTFLPVIPYRHHDPLADEAGEGGEEKRSVMLTVLRAAAVLMLVVFLFGLLDGVILGLMPIYALEQGIAEEDAALPVAAMAFGVVLMQWPLGYIADRFSKMKVLTGVLFAVVILSCGFPHVPLEGWGGIVFMLIYGAVSFAPYTLALSILGDRYRGQALAVASGLFAIMWGMGGTVGPIAVGWGMEAFGAHALPYSLAGFFLIAALAALTDRQKAS